ncbi:S-adenosyl-L-methionine-dependent methyltransferase [Melia azedarach]|uniref:S-adenosyl-L-methionine-dependent methyltransferase n=1 Tax=Melia azedarach TaxID=155640 RepID=A0ACC1XCZ0_MELAZ|nr:S-adenosyl-L-methionine-dependent methyltransferase [Melia azedarach]
MATLPRIKLQHRLPVLPGVCYCYSSTPSVTSFSSVNSVSGFSKKCEGGFKASRRLVVGLGAAFWAQFMNMAGNVGANSFIASARQKGAVEQILKNVDWPEQFPFKEEDFQRLDESPDSMFYGIPRFVTHIDDPAIAALTKYYSEVFPPSNTPGVSILDMCSSWVSHFPRGYKQDRIVGMGMNEEELKKNSVLTDYVVQDLNLNPKLPFEDNSFDVITNVVSVDYLTKPLEVFKGNVPDS